MISELSMHSCSYYCDRPDCIKAQRDDLRDNYVAAKAANATLNNTRAPMELTDSDILEIMDIGLTAIGHGLSRQDAVDAARQWLAERSGG